MGPKLTQKFLKQFTPHFKAWGEILKILYSGYFEIINSSFFRKELSFWGWHRTL
jgi:hypothetical protein